MADANERFDRMEQALTGVNEQLGTVSGRITRLDEDLSGRIARLDEHLSGRLDGLDERLEQIARSIEPVKQRLDEVAKGIEPLKDLRDFVQRVAGDHERRITELEKRT
jgi:archaellum component FlaC